jgi:tRNA (guanine-N7-)-methyltransferase
MTRTSGANGGGGGGQSGKLPRKRFYRARAHSNPLSDSHFPIPISPDDFDLSQHYPRYYPADKGERGDDEEVEAPLIRFADVGCGFGGLLVGLSPLFPDKLMIGMELRDKVILMLLLQFVLLPQELSLKVIVIHMLRIFYQFNLKVMDIVHTKHLPSPVECAVCSVACGLSTSL